MATRSKRLWNWTSLAAGTNCYVVPADETALVKTIALNNNTAVATVFTVMTGANNEGNAFIRRTLLAGETALIDLWLALPGAVSVWAKAAPASANARISGYGAELEGVTD